MAYARIDEKNSNLASYLTRYRLDSKFIVSALLCLVISFPSIQAWGQGRSAIIESFMVVSAEPDKVTIKAIYTLDETGNTAVFMGGDMRSKHGDVKTRGFTPVMLQKGRHAATISIIRPHSPLAKQTHILDLYLYEGGKTPFMHRTFDLVIEWPEKTIPIQASGQNQAAYNEVLLNEAIDLIDGISYLGDEQLNVAKKRLDQIILSDPSNTQAYLELARIAMKADASSSGHINSTGFDEADRLIKTALKLDPNYANSHVLMGYVDTVKGRFIEAEKHFKTAKRIGTANMWLYHNWGMLLRKTQRSGEAIKLYEEAIALPIPTNVRFAKSNNRSIPIIYDALIDLYAERNNWQAIEKTYQKRISALNEPCTPATYARFKLFQMGNFPEAIRLASIAYSNDCTDYARPVLAEAYFSEWALGPRSKPESERQAMLNKAQALTQNMPQVVVDLANSSKTAGVLPHLKEAGIDYDSTDAKGMTPLAYAVAYNQVTATKNLLEAGAKANRVLNNQGWTILMLAVTTGRQDVVEMLLKHKADPTSRTVDGITAMSIAKEAGMTDIASRLERRRGL